MIDYNDVTPNRARRFGSEPSYIRSVVLMDGTLQPALFTRDQIAVALARAADNPEDAPDVRPWWQRIFT
jgi:hypothetical protein